MYIFSIILIIIIIILGVDKFINHYDYKELRNEY